MHSDCITLHKWIFWPMQREKNHQTAEMVIFYHFPAKNIFFVEVWKPNGEVQAYP